MGGKVIKGHLNEVLLNAALSEMTKLLKGIKHVKMRFYCILYFRKEITVVFPCAGLNNITKVERNKVLSLVEQSIRSLPLNISHQAIHTFTFGKVCNVFLKCLTTLSISLPLKNKDHLGGSVSCRRFWV